MFGQFRYVIVHVLCWLFQSFAINCLTSSLWLMHFFQTINWCMVTITIVETLLLKLKYCFFQVALCEVSNFSHNFCTVIFWFLPKACLIVVNAFSLANLWLRNHSQSISSWKTILKHSSMFLPSKWKHVL